MRMMRKCELGTVGFISPKTLLVEIEPKSEIGVEHISAFKNIAAELARKEKVYSIVNFGSLSLPTKEAREFCCSDMKNDYLLARAIVVNDLGQMILARHTIRRKQADFPSQVFTSVDDAIKWVEELKIDNIESQLIAKCN